MKTTVPTATGLLAIVGLFLVIVPLSASVEIELLNRVNDICSVADKAGDLATEELRKLIADCTSLLVEIETDETDKREELISRIKACRDTLRQNLDPKEEFERLCGAVEEAPELSPEELTNLIADCDWLLLEFDKMPGPEKKVYIFRLKKCRNFFSFSLEFLKSEE
jgi:hypothetical protein